MLELLAIWQVLSQLTVVLASRLVELVHCCRTIRKRNHGNRLMTRIQEAIGLGLILGVIHGLVQSAGAVPVVPNFTQGSMTSHTETTSKQTETINSIDYATGWQYSVSGTNVTNNGAPLLPPTTKNNSDSDSSRRNRRTGETPQLD